MSHSFRSSTRSSSMSPSSPSLPSSLSSSPCSSSSPPPSPDLDSRAISSAHDRKVINPDNNHHHHHSSGLPHRSETTSSILHGTPARERDSERKAGWADLPPEVRQHIILLLLQSTAPDGPQVRPTQSRCKGWVSTVGYITAYDRQARPPTSSRPPSSSASSIASDDDVSSTGPRKIPASLCYPNALQSSSSHSLARLAFEIKKLTQISHTFCLDSSNYPLDQLRAIFLGELEKEGLPPRIPAAEEDLNNWVQQQQQQQTGPVAPLYPPHPPNSYPPVASNGSGSSNNAANPTAPGSGASAAPTTSAHTPSLPSVQTRTCVPPSTFTSYLGFGTHFPAHFEGRPWTRDEIVRIRKVLCRRDFWVQAGWAVDYGATVVKERVEGRWWIEAQKRRGKINDKEHRDWITIMDERQRIVSGRERAVAAKERNVASAERNVAERVREVIEIEQLLAESIQAVEERERAIGFRSSRQVRQLKRRNELGRMNGGGTRAVADAKHDLEERRHNRRTARELTFKMENCRDDSGRNSSCCNKFHEIQPWIPDRALMWCAAVYGSSAEQMMARKLCSQALQILRR